MTLMMALLLQPLLTQDTDDDWLKGDRVGIRIPKDKIIIEEINEESESN